MAIKVALNHRTQYKYDRLVALGPQVIRLRPSAHCRTPVLSYSLKVVPSKHHLNWHQDPYGNYVARLIVPDKTAEFSVEVDLIADLSPINPFDFFVEAYADKFPFLYPADLAHDLEPYRAVQAPGPLFKTFLQGVSQVPRSSVSFVMDLSNKVRDAIGYTARLTPGIQTIEETLERGSGSCRDSAWLLVQMLRQNGLAARFVSGYLVQLASEAEAGAAPAQDSVDLHAWAEVYLPGAGWIGLDPTSGFMTAENHIPLAVTPEPSHASPITGTVEPAGVTFSYSMAVHRFGDAPHTSRPISDRDWATVEVVARKVDDDLATHDVRLTMGGEPTFVGLDEPNSPQWNGEALGELKRNLGVKLIRGIQQRFAPGALLHFGQGKWYPGEPLPRWAFGCFWRADHAPVWERSELVADEESKSAFDHADALTFTEHLSRRLGVSAGNILAAYEDPFFYLWKESKLPVNVTAADSNVAEARQREELKRVFEYGLGKPVGYVLPVRRRQHEGRVYWSSQLWFLRPEKLLLMQGDSPIGYRLPLDSLPWVAPDEIEYDYEEDPFSSRERLPERPVRRPELFNVEPPEDPLPAPPRPGESAANVIRPALCVQAREGRLHVFLPFTVKLPDYLDIVSAVEDTAAYLGKPVWIEGYGPPSDPRLKSFTITPDPGVIEVNLPPASNWTELEQINRLVFEEAVKCRLTAEKFLYDGKHTATGGGSHIVVGGPTASDSPLLRKPHLLRSMLAFWQNHPSLSYLFSGNFIGPTSQHPRVDEARMDALYELEIAFTQLPTADCPPWLVDRLFRNLLVDMTGNTHRAEFCIDKLYPPQGSGSRLGLLELRAFEMTPHVSMGLLELLLVRALVAMFWQRPYQHRLIRWGTGLHDRFLLPHFVRQDFLEVLRALQQFGYELDERWFGSHLEFRFPKIGSIDCEGLQLELRHALEPWHVMGEEASSGGTSRSVDSSLERIQVRVSGLTESRYAVSCNGRRVPLHSTGSPGEFAAGVRFRAWRPPSCLHPTIPVQAPLVFDIVDIWNGHSIAGCTYHVTHPGGRWYNDRPVSADEAKSRRAERFVASGHTPGAIMAPEEETNPVLPMTLDLRWPAPGSTGRLGAGALSA